MQDMLGRISMLDTTQDSRSRNLLLGSIAALFGLFLLGVNNVLGPSASAVLVALLGVALAVQAPPTRQTAGPVAYQDPETGAGCSFLESPGGVAAHGQCHQALRRITAPASMPELAAPTWDHLPQQEIFELRAREAKASRVCSEAQAETRQAIGHCRELVARVQFLEQELHKEREASEENRGQTSHATSALQSQLIQLQRCHEALSLEARMASDKLARAEVDHTLELQRLEQAHEEELRKNRQAAERAQRDAIKAVEDARESAAQLGTQHQECQAREVEVGRLKEQVSRQNEAYEEAASQAGVVAMKLEALQREHDRKQQQNKETREKLHLVESALEESRAAADQAEADAARVRKQLQELRRTQNDEFEELRDREQQAVKRAEAAEHEASRTSSSSAEWERQAAELRTEISKLQDQLHELQKERRKLQQQRRHSKGETEEAAAQMVHLSSQLQRLQEDNERLREAVEVAQEQVADAGEQLEQAQQEANRATEHASELLQQLENCQQEIGEMKADERGTADKARWASKLSTQLKDLQKEHDAVQRQRRGLLGDLQQERLELEKQKQNAQRAQDALVQERKRSLLLEAELNRCKEERRSTPGRERLRHSYTSPSMDSLSDDAAIETLGAMLQRSMQQAPTETRQNFKRQLLLCFHPDRNPATEVATRVTQILNCT